MLAPIEGSPAERAGIRAGDAIVSIDGNDPGAEPLDKLVKRLRGAPGSHVKVGVRRGTAAAILSFDLVREIVHVQSVSSKLLADRVAYVHIKQFQEHTHDELLGRGAPSCAKRAGGTLAGVVLDLRGDPGGLVDQATDVADEFLDEGVIYTTRHRGQVVDEVQARGRAARSQGSRASSSSISTRRALRSSWQARCRITSGRRWWASPRSARGACRRSSRCRAARACA